MDQSIDQANTEINEWNRTIKGSPVSPPTSSTGPVMSWNIRTISAAILPASSGPALAWMQKRPVSPYEWL